MKPLPLLLGGALLALPVAWLIRHSRFFTPGAPYRLLSREGTFEWRDYPPLTLASTPMDAPGGRTAFRRLLGYLTGRNTAHRPLPMTTPVLIGSPQGEPAMSFILPPMDALPEPETPEIHLAPMPPGRYAIHRFPGRRNAPNERKAAAELEQWLDRHGTAGEGAPAFAYFDPPWTPGFLRRNEVMVRVG